MNPTRTAVIDWNGRDLPEVLHKVVPGRYVLVPLDAAVELDPDEAQGLLDAVEEGDRAEVVTGAQLHAELRALAGGR